MGFSRVRVRFWRAGVAAVVAAVAGVGLGARQGYEADIRQWRAAEEAELRADDGWLTVAGLFWLDPGLSHVGADPSNEVVLPDGSAPARLGWFEFLDGRVEFRAEPGTRVTSAGRPVDRLDLTPGPRAATLDTAGLTMFVIRRGERTGIRLRDRNNPARRQFTGRSWYPVDPGWKVTARFTAYDAPEVVHVPNVLGDSVEMDSPGVVEFALGDQSFRLVPVLETPDAAQLFFIIGDQTNGDETYDGGRFLYAELPRDGAVVLDFNKLYNPPCVFTEFATCPLPPPANQLAARIEAGELMYGTPGRHR